MKTNTSRPKTSQSPSLLVALCLALTLSLFSLSSLAFAADKHDHDKDHDHHHHESPKGGRILEKTSPHAEFVIEKDRTVSIHFYDEAMKPVPPTTQSVTVLADTKSGKTKITLEKSGDSLSSKTPLPEGHGYLIVLQFKSAPTAKPQNFRIKMDLNICGECKKAEYACTCQH